MKARIAAFLVWAVVAAVAVYWLLRLLAAPMPLPASVQPVSMAGAVKGDMARLFATPEAPVALAAVEPALASRFKLIGVVAPKDAARGDGQGIALIAVDDKPPRPYRIGASLGDSLVLQSVVPRGATLGPAAGPASVHLAVPGLPPPATGTRPGVASNGSPRLGGVGQMMPAPAPGAAAPAGGGVTNGEVVEPEPPPAEEPPPEQGGVPPQPVRNLR